MQALVPDPPLKTRACRTLLDTWRAWRGARLLPSHEDVDPVALKWVLSRVGIIEMRAPDVAIYRVAGTSFRDTVGFDPTGRNAVDLARSESRPMRAYRLSQLVLQPCGYRSETKFAYSTGLTDTFESIGLPLRSDRPDILGFIIFAMESIVGRRWQNVKATEASMIESDAEVFQFLDIGAGVPAHVYPPPNPAASS